APAAPTLPAISSTALAPTGASATSASGGSTSSPGAQPDASEAVAPPTASEAIPSQGEDPENASASATPPESPAEAAPREDPKAIDASGHAKGHAANGNGSASVANGNGGGGGGTSTGAITMSLGATKVSFQTQADAPSCAECGSIMVRNGSCYKCLNCGSTSGCSCAHCRTSVFLETYQPRDTQLSGSRPVRSIRPRRYRSTRRSEWLREVGCTGRHSAPHVHVRRLRPERVPQLVR